MQTSLQAYQIHPFPSSRVRRVGRRGECKCGALGVAGTMRAPYGWSYMADPTEAACHANGRGCTGQSCASNSLCEGSQ